MGGKLCCQSGLGGFGFGWLVGVGFVKNNAVVIYSFMLYICIAFCVGCYWVGCIKNSYHSTIN